MSKKKNKKRKQQQQEKHEVSHNHSENTTTKKKKKKRKVIENPLLEKQQAFLQQLKSSERDSFFSEEHVTPERRAEIWMQQAELGEELVNKYAWATPDERAFRVLQHFSPLIEIGCGANAYWCQLMYQQGIDVVGYDVDVKGGGKIARGKEAEKDHDATSFRVRKGGPKELGNETHKHRTLFLCYPDESFAIHEEEERATSMGALCLEYYSGDYVIHVGELYDDFSLSVEQAPWGRSSSPEFQERLASEFHCVLRIGLPNWVHTRDCLTVWKRSKLCTMVFAAESDDEDEGEDDEEVAYRHIPIEERLPTDRVAPCLQHLLEATSTDDGHRTSHVNSLAAETTNQAVIKKVEMNDGSEYETPW